MSDPFGRIGPPDRVPLTHQQVTVALIKAAGIHEGLWRVQFEFDLMAMNAAVGPGETVPGAFIPVRRLALVHVKTMPEGGLRALVVDASEVNPQKRIITPRELVN